MRTVEVRSYNGSTEITIIRDGCEHVYVPGEDSLTRLDRALEFGQSTSLTLVVVFLYKTGIYIRYRDREQ
jgi:hypothetical protein